jgi:tetratricopeptide (TPR) repeat protein
MATNLAGSRSSHNWANALIGKAEAVKRFANTREMIMRLRFYGVVVGLLLVGCGPTDADRKVLTDAYARYGTRDFAGTEELAGKYIDKEPTADNVDEAFYLRGLARYGRGDRIGATADLGKALERTKRADMKYKANMTLGDIAFDQYRWEEAVADYQKALGAGAGVEPRLQFRLGAALQAVGQWDNARAHFEAVAGPGGDAALAERARERMEARVFSLQFGAFKEGVRAGDLARQLKAAGIPANVASELRDKQLVFVVRAGSYTTWADAEAARKRVAVRYPGAVVVP